MMSKVASFVAVCALLAMPLVGCSSSTNEGAGEGGAGGQGGEGGSPGSGGEGGSGGEAASMGIWTGTGDGGDGTFFICFNVNEDGSALVRPLDSSNECMGWSLWVEFDGCEGGFSTTEEIPIVDGSFRLLNEQGGLAGYWDIQGTLDAQTASGEATVGAVPEGTCSGSWTASPAQ